MNKTKEGRNLLKILRNLLRLEDRITVDDRSQEARFNDRYATPQFSTILLYFLLFSHLSLSFEQQSYSTLSLCLASTLFSISLTISSPLSPETSIILLYIYALIIKSIFSLYFLSISSSIL